MVQPLPCRPRRCPPASCLVFVLACCIALCRVPAVHGLPSTLRVLTGGGGGSRAFNCMPQPHRLQTSARFNNATVSLVYLRPSGAGEGCVKMLGGAASDGTATTIVTGSTFEFDGADLAAVNGSVAVLRGSSCPFSTVVDNSRFAPWRYYLNDYQTRVDAALKAGAVGVLWGEGVAGKIPESMSPFNQMVPVCTFEMAEFDALLTATGLASAAAGSSVAANTEATLMYRIEDDVIPNPPITYITVEERWKPGGPEGFTFPIPTFSATFNPPSHPGVEAPVVAADFVDECKKSNYADCTSCWARTAAGRNPFVTDLTKKIAFFAITAASEVGCYPSFNQWAIAAERAGAVATVHGTFDDINGWGVPGPYLVPFNISAPFFSLLKIHTDTVMTALAESASHPNHTLQLKTPPLVGGAGPTYFAQTSKQYGPAPLLFWKSLDKHFICDAGQAHFSPSPWPGLPLPRDASGELVSALDANRVVVLSPSQACKGGSDGTSTCGACLLQQPSQQVSRAFTFIGNATVELSLPLTGNGGLISTAFAMKTKFGNDIVAAIFVSDFDCFAAYEQWVDVAVAAGAKAMILILQPGQQAGTIYGTAEIGEGKAPDAKESIPSFTVTNACGIRALLNAESIHVDIPAIGADGEVISGANAAAAGYTSVSTDSLEDTVLTVIEGPRSLCGGASKCLAGQARWNPKTYPAVHARMIAVQTIKACHSSLTCLACDAAASKPNSNGTLDKYTDFDGSPLTAESIKGAIVFMTERQMACLKPYTNALRDAQEAGALGLIIGNNANNTVTMAQSAVPFEIKIPAFNLADGVGEGFSQALKANKVVSIRLPRIESGVALTDGVFSVNDGTLVYGRGFEQLNPSPPGPSSSGLSNNDIIAIGVGNAAAVIFIVAGIAIYRWRRQRRMFTRNQTPMSTQTFVDISGGGLLGSAESERSDDLVSGRSTYRTAHAPTSSEQAKADIEMGTAKRGSGGRSMSTSTATIGTYVSSNQRGIPLFTEEEGGGSSSPGASGAGPDVGSEKSGLSADGFTPHGANGGWAKGGKGHSGGGSASQESGASSPDAKLPDSNPFNS